VIDESAEILRDILCRTTARYLSVRPQGLLFEDSSSPVPTVQATITGHGGARTLYSGRRPRCRSLNGLHAVDDPRKSCRDCRLRRHCTPQVCVYLFIEERPYRLLLAFTSARRFLEYHADLQRRSIDPETVTTIITVINRGSWGELRFERESQG
jgi:hypothetical protein